MTKAKQMEAEEKGLDYIKLLTYINQYHPTRLPNEGEREAAAGEPKEVSFGICETLGSLQLCRCCRGDTTPMAK